jgi:hypothetical protein
LRERSCNLSMKMANVRQIFVCYEENEVRASN